MKTEIIIVIMVLMLSSIVIAGTTTTNSRDIFVVGQCYKGRTITDVQKIPVLGRPDRQKLKWEKGCTEIPRLEVAEDCWLVDGDGNQDNLNIIVSVASLKSDIGNYDLILNEFTSKLSKDIKVLEPFSEIKTNIYLLNRTASYSKNEDWCGLELKESDIYIMVWNYMGSYGGVVNNYPNPVYTHIYSYKTVFHEIGHTFGLAHPDALFGDCFSIYGNLMKYGMCKSRSKSFIYKYVPEDEDYIRQGLLDLNTDAIPLY